MTLAAVPDFHAPGDKPQEPPGQGLTPCLPATAPSGQEPCQPRTKAAQPTLPSETMSLRRLRGGERISSSTPGAGTRGHPSGGQGGLCGRDLNSLLGPRGPALWSVASLLAMLQLLPLVTRDTAQETAWREGG